MKVIAIDCSPPFDSSRTILVLGPGCSKRWARPPGKLGGAESAVRPKPAKSNREADCSRDRPLEPRVLGSNPSRLTRTSLFPPDFPASYSRRVNPLAQGETICY